MLIAYPNVSFEVIHTFVFPNATVDVEEDERGGWMFTVLSTRALVPRHTNNPMVAAKIVVNTSRWCK